MSRSLRRGAIAALVLAIAPLSACAASNDAQTTQIEPDNVNANAGVIKLRNVVVVVSPAGSDAAVSVNVVNTGSTEDHLESVDVQGAGAASLPDAKGGGVVLPAGRGVLLGGPGRPQVTVTGATLQPGTYTPVTFTFGSAGTTTVDAYVVPGTGEYSSFAPSAAPSASPASATAGAASSESPAAGASGAASGGSPKSSPKSSPKPTKH